MNNGWKSATTEQRIAQVKGAIEIGLTQRETALLLGCNVWNISQFASWRKGRFGGETGILSKGVRLQAFRKLNAERYRAGYNDAAHEIFPREQDVFLEPRK